jgi:hypothetical protein
VEVQLHRRSRGAAPDVGDRPAADQLGERRQHRPVPRLAREVVAEVVGVRLGVTLA